jgi:DNA-binding transcriptional regulator LsrR (DeoR family)
MVASGKSKMTAIVACMRKLMILRNTLIRQNRPWRPKTA